MTERRSRTHIAFVLSALLLSLASATVGAHAQDAAGPAAASTSGSGSDEIARGLFQAGRAAYGAGNYADALEFFEQAYARSPRPGLLYNIGQAADRLRKDERALAAFRAFLEQSPQTGKREEVEARIAALERARAEREPGAVAASTTVPTPAQTAAAAQPQQHAAAQGSTAAPARAEAGEPITSRWWFWTGVGGVVLGGTALALALAFSGDAAGAASPYQGNGGSLQGP